MTSRPHRLVIKLTLLLLVLSLTIAAGFYWISSRDIGNHIQRTLFPNLQQHVVYLIQDIRHNHNPFYIQELADRLNLDISMKTPIQFWSTTTEVTQKTLQQVHRKLEKRGIILSNKRRPGGQQDKPKYLEVDENEDEDDRHHKNRNNRRTGELEHIPWRRLSRKQPALRDGRFYSFHIDRRPGILYKEKNMQIMLLYREELRPLTEINYLKILGWVILMMLIAFILLYRMMRPLKDLREGVEAIEQGNFDTTIRQKSKDELGRLAQSFNKMTASIREQMKRKEQLLFDMSHELRSPLARIKVALEFLSDSNSKDMIREDIHEQEIIIEELLENARLKNQGLALNKDSVDIQKLITGVIAKRKLKRIHYIGTEHTIWVDLDTARIQRVLNNLLDNAMKYAPKRSRIDVTLQQEQHYMRVTVADIGLGIDEADKERIFEPFYRLDSSRTKDTGGYGLGLSLCRQIIEAHKGHIYAENLSPQGLKVVFTLPHPSAEKKV